MRKMRFAMVMAAVFACVGSVAKAQDPAQQGGPPRRGGMNMQAMMFNGITLTDAQKAKVDSIQSAYREKNQTLMEAARGGDQDARQKMMANRQAQMTDIKAVLTDEQKPIFDKNMEAMRSRMQQRQGGPPPTL